MVVALCALGAGLGRSAAAEARPDFAAALTLYETRAYSAAREKFTALAKLHPNDPDLDFYLGRLALWFDDLDAALLHLERGAKTAPNDARIQNALGDAYGLAAQNAPLLAKLGWARQCRAAYERAVSLAPGNPAFRWSLVGYFCMAPRVAGGGMEKAYAQAEEIRKLDPMGGRIAFATLHLAEKKFDAAFAQFDPVLGSEPENFLALYQIGRCAALSGRQLERGLAALRRCLQLAPPPGDGMPTHASVHHRIGNILERQGQAAAAQASYATALELHPDFRATKIALKN